jgi:hypothetical protein
LIAHAAVALAELVLDLEARRRFQEVPRTRLQVQHGSSSAIVPSRAAASRASEVEARHVREGKLQILQVLLDSIPDDERSRV